MLLSCKISSALLQSPQMKLIQKMLILTSILIFSALFYSTPIEAVSIAQVDGATFEQNKDDCEGVSTGVKIDGNNCIGDDSGDINTNPIIVLLKLVINFLAVGVGIVAAISIIVAGIQWSASRDNPQALQQAQNRMTNAVIGVLLFIFMYAILNFLVPGGLIG